MGSGNSDIFFRNKHYHYHIHVLDSGHQLMNVYDIYVYMYVLIAKETSSARPYEMLHRYCSLSELELDQNIICLGRLIIPKVFVSCYKQTKVKLYQSQGVYFKKVDTCST